MEKHRFSRVKRIACSRSLGGHMRFSSPAELETENPTKKIKKRLSDLAGDEPTPSSSSIKLAGDEPTPSSSSIKLAVEKQCKVCLKEFPSWKALFGHMRCHSDKIFRRSFSEAEEKNQRQQEEEVAISLMMLSRGINGCWRIIAVSDSSDNQSITKEIQFLSAHGKKRGRMDEKERHNCTICSKNFRSYQALGGHRTSHKIAVEEQNQDERSRIHECSICGKTYASGQALGGHKRSHLTSAIASSDPNNSIQELRLDLNLPAPPVQEELGTTSNAKQWWIGLDP